MTAAGSHRSQRRRRARPGRTRDRIIPISVADDTEAVIVAQAAFRGMTKATLVGWLVEVICDDNLFNAVLDGDGP
jgi:hypothetical protein